VTSPCSFPQRQRIGWLAVSIATFENLPGVFVGTEEVQRHVGHVPYYPAIVRNRRKDTCLVGSLKALEYHFEHGIDSW
jgi:hypothetical protein